MAVVVQVAAALAERLQGGVVVSLFDALINGGDHPLPLALPDPGDPRFAQLPSAVNVAVVVRAAWVPLPSPSLPSTLNAGSPAPAGFTSTVHV